MTKTKFNKIKIIGDSSEQGVASTAADRLSKKIEGWVDEMSKQYKNFEFSESPVLNSSSSVSENKNSSKNEHCSIYIAIFYKT